MPNQTSDDAPAGPVVVLVDPAGREYTSSSPLEISNLHYAQGYAFKDDLTFHQAVTSLVAEVEETPPAEEEPPVETPEPAPAPKPAAKPEPPKEPHD